MANYKLFNFDAIQGMKNLITQNVKVDCIITDPPYKLTSRGSSGTMGGEFWTSERAKQGLLFSTPDITDWIDLCYDLLNEGTHIYIMTNDKNLTHYLDTIKKSKFEFVKTIIWVKPNKITGRFYMTQKETIILARKGGQRPINNAGTSDILFSPEFKKLKKEDGTTYPFPKKWLIEIPKIMGVGVMEKYGKRYLLKQKTLDIKNKSKKDLRENWKRK